MAIRIPIRSEVHACGGGRDVHVVPIGDLREHEETLACWCGPRLQRADPESTAYVVVHHSADGRELVEQHGVN